MRKCQEIFPHTPATHTLDGSARPAWLEILNPCLSYLVDLICIFRLLSSQLGLSQLRFVQKDARPVLGG